MWFSENNVNMYTRTHTHMYFFIYIYIYNIYNIDHYSVAYRLVSRDPIVSFFFPKIIEYPANGGGGLYCIVSSFSSDPFFSGGALSTFIHLSLGKAGPFTLGSHIHGKALNMQGSQKNKCFIKPLLQTAPKQFFKGVPHEWPRYSIM